MTYSGHIEKGMVVIDEPVSLPEGTKVRIELVGLEIERTNRTRLRGTPYRFDDPFSPAVPETDWNASE